jgi:thioredoxin-like negative regulator of GroEL
MSTRKTILSEIPTREVFLNLLQHNPGLFVVKLGATWCGPCKKIQHAVDAFFAQSPPEVMCADLDVDTSDDVYAFLRNKKMVNGIPVLLCYQRGNTQYIPDDSVTGSNPEELHHFFLRCSKRLSHVRSTQGF